MNKRKKRPNYTNVFREDAIKLVVEPIAEAGLMDEKRLVELKNKANEIFALVAAFLKTARPRK